MSDDLVQRLRDLGIRVENGMVLERDGMVLEGATLAIDLDDDAYVLPSGSERNLVALPARDDNGVILNPEIWRGMVFRFNAYPALTALAEAAEAERDAMAAENSRLREALKPFANYAKSLKGWGPTEAVCSETGIDFERVVNAGDFFAARAALKGEQK